jgi:hypothetical protein
MTKKNLLLLFVLIVSIGIGFGLKMFFKTHADINKLDADYKLEASKLIEEFNSDETKATAKYSEKVLEINGNLVAKSKLSNGTDLLVLEDEMQGISCQLDSVWAAKNQPAIESLTTGAPVTVKGVCKGYLMEIKVSPAVLVSK